MSLASHDKSLKYLLSQEPAEFIGFGRGDSVRVLRPVEGDLPARDRLVDGGYRRHENLLDVALDIAEAQVRFHRKERAPVYTHLWDLYGSRQAPVLEDRTVPLGRPQDAACTRVVYRRINLRGMGAVDLLERGPKAFYPLVPLTRDGADLAHVRRAAEAITSRSELSPSKRADHLTVLRFLAEAEDMPKMMLESLLTKEKLMESSLYRSILDEGVAKGRADDRAELLIRLLTVRLGHVSQDVRQIIQAQALTSPDTVLVWFDEAALATDPEAAQRLVRKISAT